MILKTGAKKKTNEDDEDENEMQELMEEEEKNENNQNNDKNSTASSPPLLFGSFTNPDCFSEQRKYEDLGGLKGTNLIALVQSYLNEYNMSRADGGMDLVLFTYCIEHIIRVCRCLSQRGGNALLVGVGGSGRKSVTALASFISNQKLEQIELTKR